MQEATTTATTMTVTAAPAAMAITVMAAPTTPVTVIAATLGITTGNTTPNSNTSTLPAISNVTGTTASDDNPFLGTLPYNRYVEQPLEGQLCILTIHLPESSPISQSDNNASEASACQKGQKEAKDMKVFFHEDKNRQYCKFCM